jgi:hypothetical protein
MEKMLIGFGLTRSQAMWREQVHDARQAFEVEANRNRDLHILVDGLLREAVRDIARSRLEACLLPLDASLTRLDLLLGCLR